MEYSLETIIKVPLNDFANKYWNVDSRYHWQRGLISLEHISGDPGKEGSKMKMTYKMGKRLMVIIETVDKSTYPKEYHARYHTKGMDNLQQNYFEQTSEGHTKWISKNTFYPLNFTMRLFSVFMPRAFKKQSKLYMKDFKSFAEKGKSVKPT